MGKNVAVFVDVANIFYAAKAAGVDIDYVTLLKSATAGRDFVRAYAYTGLDPDNENQRNFHSFLARNHYKVVSKDIRKYGDGKVKANLDIELVVDLMKTARNLDVAIVVSGDGDFAPAIRAVQEMGVRVEVISFRGNTSSDLIEVADLFTDITQLARVEKGSSRSGRRVAGDDEDLSMTEVPDKQTEGTGAGRSRGRGRGRGRAGEAEPVAARGRTPRLPAPLPNVAAAGVSGVTVLPGEKLSRIAPAPAADLEPVADESAIVEPGELGEDGGLDGEGRRRRRRRGGRGRGRGRGREQEAGTAPTGEPAEGEEEDEERDDVAEAPLPRAPRATPFGSFWDSQLGVPSTAPSNPVPLGDDDDFEEPEIPEYLIAEQRRGGQPGRSGRGVQQPGRGGPRGGRAGYNAAVDRERFGRGGGGGINRYPDVSGRERQARTGRPAESGYRGDRSDRPDRSDRGDRPVAPRSSEPWSEVPAELEELLRAQLAQSPKAPPRGPQGGRGTPTQSAAPAETASPATAAGDETPAPKARATTRRKPAASTGGETVSAAGDGAAATPKRRTTTRRTTAAASTEASATPKRRTTRATAGASSAESPKTDAPADEAGAAAAPKRRATRKKAEPA